MKKLTIFLGIVTILFCFNNCINIQRTVGNGNLVTNTISINDYIAIHASGCPMEIRYEQSENAPFFEVTTDENIYELFEFYTNNNNELIIRLKEVNNRFGSIEPTTFIIKTNSSTLNGIRLSGSSRLFIDNSLKTDRLDARISGSGKVLLNGEVQANSIKCTISGSGRVEATNVVANDFTASISGAGRVIAAGQAESAEMNISGSGRMEAFNMVIKNMDANISGSGRIEIDATEKIKARVSGSGNIYYKGNPEVSSSISGSGRITKQESSAN